MFFVVGGKGLTGSAIIRLLENEEIEYKIIQRENKKDFFGKSCDVLIYANGNPLRYKANEDPFFDFKASVESVAEYIHNIDCKLFVHISSIIVYDKINSKETTKENITINVERLDNYGYHKILAENYVKKYSKNFLIFRLPGLVGKNLEKNPAYDYINKEKRVMISSESTLNFINTDKVAKSILKIIQLNIKNDIFNLASKNSIKIKDIEKVIGYNTKYTSDAEKSLQNYQINIEKIQQYVEMTTSEEAIKEYFEQLEKN
jgi:nucleoside-diphosphate-sugar epimerase